jgi:tetratricopeptide (TPR) repeat protein
MKRLIMMMGCLMGWGINACQLDQSILNFQQQRTAQAAAGFEVCLQTLTTEQVTDRAQAHFYLGVMAREAGDLSSSINHLTAASELRPGQLNYGLELAVSTERTGAHDEALQIYRELLRQQDLTGARLGEARMLHWLGQVKEAIGLYQQLVADHPKEIGAQLGLGHAMLGNHQKQSAIRVFNGVLAQHPDHAGAIKGLLMANSQFNRRVNLIRGIEQTNGEQRHNNGIELFVQSNKRLQWGLAYQQTDGLVSAPQDSGLPEFRAASNNRSGFVTLHQQAGGSWTLGYARQDLEQGHQQRIKLSHNRPLNDHNQWSATVERIKASEGGEAWLMQLGWSRHINQRNTLLGQLYVSHDSEFGDGQALSVSAIHHWSNQAMLHAGISHSRSINDPTWTGFMKIEVPAKDQWRFGLAWVQNFTNNDRSLTGTLLFNF